ncbi:MAG: site-specific DNA-methyltransferase [Nanoarchaeota archaeon]
MLLEGNSLEILPKFKKDYIDLIFADPPYRLSSGGVTCKSGRIVSVNKGDWDKSQGFEKDYEFTKSWISLCKEILKPEGTIWITGTPHNIYQVGYALQSSGFHILNEIIWYKPNAPPNLACRCFAHAHETILWAKKSKSTKHYFNYNLMKEYDDGISPKGKQMRSIWKIPLTSLKEKQHGKHPTQKPTELLKRIILSTSKEGDIVMDPFNGSGTTGLVAQQLKRKYIGIEMDKNFLDLTIRRVTDI